MLNWARNQHLFKYEKLNLDLCADISGSLISWFSIEEYTTEYISKMDPSIISLFDQLSLGPK